jgi:hypothetical protein
MDFDIILLNQGALNGFDYNTDQPYLNDFIDAIQGYIHYDVNFCFLINNSFPTASAYLDPTDPSYIGVSTPLAMFQMTASAAQSVKNETIVQEIIPVGTAIQNARTVPDFAAIGINGDLCSDDMHLQEGLPILIECYVFAISIVNMLSPKNSIVGSRIRPDADWAESINAPQRAHGTNIGITDANCLLGLKCAIMAIKYPYTVTDIQALFNN